MRKAGLFASILAGIAACVGVVSTPSAPRAAGPYARLAVGSDSQTTGTQQAPPAAATTVQTIRAGETVVPIGRIVYLNRRWNWVGRKHGGRFDFSCRPCSEPSEGRANRALRKWEARRQAKANRMTQARVMELAHVRRHLARAGYAV